MLTPLAAQSDSLAIPTFIIALLGLLGALGSLAWQFVTFSLSGPQINVTLSLGAESADGRWIVGGRISKAKEYMESVENDTEFEPIVLLNIRSTGRMPANVVGFWLCFPIDARIEVQPIAGYELPVRLDPGDSEYWKLPNDSISRVKARSVWARIFRKRKPYFAIELGDGRMIEAKKHPRFRR